jgi:uncharacterized protein (AIM24 family)
MSLKLNSSGGGSVLLQEPSTASNRTLTLPDADGTVIYSDASANLQFNSGYGSLATAYGCRAWVNFNGTGTVAIRASGNVTSITDNATGEYTVNFTTAMVDANYALVISAGTSGGNARFVNPARAVPTTSAARVFTTDGSFTGFDSDYNYVAVFR